MEIEIRWHTVVSGDTIPDICQKYALTWEEFMHMNPVKKPPRDALHLGEKVQVGPASRVHK